MSKLSYKIVLKTPEQVIANIYCRSGLFLEADLNREINSCRQSEDDTVTTHFLTTKKINYFSGDNLYTNFINRFNQVNN